MASLNSSPSGTVTATSVSPTSFDRSSSSSSYDHSKQTTPRSLATPDRLSKDSLFRKATRSPIFTVATEFEGSNSVMTSKGTVAPSNTSRTHSPSSNLVWNESGWNAGHFNFSPFSSDEVESKRGSPKEEEEDRGEKVESVSEESTRGSSQLSEKSEEKEKAPMRKTEEVSIASTSKLAPTAQPFVFSPKPPQPSPTVSTPPFARLSPLDTSATMHSEALPFPSVPSSFSSPTSSRFTSNGRILDQGSQYEIADEILKIQSTPLNQMQSDYAEELSNLDPFVDQRSQHPYRGREIEEWTAEQQQYYNSMNVAPEYAPSPFERTRSSSIASTSSYFASPRGSFDRNSTVQQLNSYFGPSPIEATPPILPTGFDNFSPNPYSMPSSRSSSLSMPDSGIYPPLAHPEPFNLTPEDPLYLQAREIYIKSCCSSLKVVPPVAKLWEIGEHFDKAMTQENPLSALYGVPSEQTKAFYANPTNSGIDALVVKVSAMRGRQNQMLSVQRSAAGQILPGPSPNNRKLELYKTELCRSWEEKGSCRYGFKCQFAHGRDEQREMARHPKFKSELCRTFAVQGSCPYGRRCCFIHQALPAGGSTSAPASRAESPSEPVSRLAHRMTSTAVTGAPQRNFGPSLSTYLGSASNTSSSSGSALSSLTNSPTQSFRPQLPLSYQEDPRTIPDPFGDAGVGLGLSLKIGQAPPVHQEPPKSRLQRYSLSSRNSSTSLASLAHSSSGTTSPVVAAFQPHNRTNSNNSTFSSVSSATSSLSSPCLQRHGSQSSLSSSGGGTPSSPLALRPLGSHWLEHHGPSPHKDAFDWPETEDLITEDALDVSRFDRISLH